SFLYGLFRHRRGLGCLARGLPALAAFGPARALLAARGLAGGGLLRRRPGLLLTGLPALLQPGLEPAEDIGKDRGLVQAALVCRTARSALAAGTRPRRQFLPFGEVAAAVARSAGTLDARFQLRGGESADRVVPALVVKRHLALVEQGVRLC